MAGLAAMRMIGPVGSYRELGVQDHLCWVHGGRRDYRPCLHAAVPAGLTPFQVFACDDGAVGLFGEFDRACQVAFERALRRIEPASGDRELIFDMSAVAFMDHHALLALDSYAQACQVPVFARSVTPAVRRVARVLGLEPFGRVHMGGV